MRKNSLIYTFILGMIAHGYCFLNFLISHDSLNDFYVSDRWERAGFGRIFYSFYISLTRGRIVLPWLIGILTLIWISAAVYLIAKMFDVEDQKILFLIAGICVTNPTVYTLAATYLHDLDADMLEMFLAVAAAYLWHYGMRTLKTRKERLCAIFAGALVLSLSLGIYQSFVSLTITLVVLDSLKSLLEQERAGKVLKEGICVLAMLIASMMLYLLELKLFEILTGVSTINSNTYNGIGNISNAFSENLPKSIWNTYISFINAFKNYILTSYPETISLVFLGLIAGMIVVFAIIGLRKMEWSSRVLFVALSALLPFAMNLTYFLSCGAAHVLTQYAVWMLYLIVIVLALSFMKENGSFAAKKATYILLIVGVFIFIAENIQTANTVYVKKDLEAQATLSYMTRVAERMEEQEDYIPGETEVLIVGGDSLGIPKYGFERYGVLTGVSSNSSVTYEATYEDYFEYILGIPFILCENEKMVQDVRVKEMPAFPKEGSVKMIDEYLIVKLADEE